MKRQKQAAQEAAQRARAAEKSAEDARNQAVEEATHKSKAEREAFFMRVVAGISFGVMISLLFFFLTYTIPWSWLISHKNTIPLQICICMALIFASIGLFVSIWRKWCWGAVVLTLFGTLLSLIGK